MNSYTIILKPVSFCCIFFHIEQKDDSVTLFLPSKLRVNLISDEKEFQWIGLFVCNKILNVFCGLDILIAVSLSCIVSKEQNDDSVTHFLPSKLRI